MSGYKEEGKIKIPEESLFSKSNDYFFCSNNNLTEMKESDMKKMLEIIRTCEVLRYDYYRPKRFRILLFCSILKRIFQKYKVKGGIK